MEANAEAAEAALFKTLPEESYRKRNMKGKGKRREKVEGEC